MHLSIRYAQVQGKLPCFGRSVKISCHRRREDQIENLQSIRSSRVELMWVSITLVTDLSH